MESVTMVSAGNPAVVTSTGERVSLYQQADGSFKTKPHGTEYKVNRIDLGGGKETESTNRMTIRQGDVFTITAKMVQMCADDGVPHQACVVTTKGDRIPLYPVKEGLLRTKRQCDVVEYPEGGEYLVAYFAEKVDLGYGELEVIRPTDQPVRFIDYFEFHSAPKEKDVKDRSPIDFVDKGGNLYASVTGGSPTSVHCEIEHRGARFQLDPNQALALGIKATSWALRNGARLQ